MSDIPGFESSTDSPIEISPDEIEIEPGSVVKTMPSPPIRKKSMLEMAVENKYDLKTIQYLMEAHNAEEKKQAEKAYIAAMCRFKSTPLVIKKDKENPKFRSKYSSLASYLDAVTIRMSQEGLSCAWNIEKAEEPKGIRISCIVSHVDGYSKSVAQEAPPDTEGSKNSIQQKKSTDTYLRIITLTAALGIAASEATLDDDGNNTAQKSHYITEQQAITIKELIEKSNSDMGKFLKCFGDIKDVKYMPVNIYGMAVNKLNKKLEGMTK